MHKSQKVGHKAAEVWSHFKRIETTQIKNYRASSKRKESQGGSHSAEVLEAVC